MTPPPGWRNPIAAVPGQVQRGVDPSLLLPSRSDLAAPRLALQRGLIRAGVPRHTPLQVTPAGVIWDGHHAIRIAAEDGRTVEVLVVAVTLAPSGLTILQLPVR